MPPTPLALQGQRRAESIGTVTGFTTLTSPQSPPPRRKQDWELNRKQHKTVDYLHR